MHAAGDVHILILGAECGPKNRETGGKSMVNRAFLAVLLALATIVTLTSYVHAAEEGLLDAVKAGDIVAVRRLLERGANVNARDNSQETPLHHAAYWGKTEVAALLIQKGAKVNARDENE